MGSTPPYGDPSRMNKLTPEALFELVKDANNTKNLELAIDWVLGASDEERTPDVMSLLGRAYISLGRYAESLAVLAPLMNEMDQDPRWHYTVGVSLYYLDRYGEARMHFRDALLFVGEEDQGLKAEAQKMADDCSKRLGFPLSPLPFKQRVEESWKRFETNEAVLIKYLKGTEGLDPDMARFVERMAYVLEPALGEVLFEAVQMADDQYTLAVAVGDHPLGALPFMYWRDLMPESLRERWLVVVGLAQKNNLDTVFKLAPHVLCDDNGVFHFVNELTEAPEGFREIKAFKFALDLSTDKAKSAKIIMNDHYPVNFLTSFFGEARLTALEMSFEVAKEPMEHGLTLHEARERLRRYYGDELWDRYDHYEWNFLPQYDLEFDFKDHQFDMRKLFTHFSSRLPWMVSDYLQEDDGLPLMAEQMGLMPVTLAFDGKWEDVSEAMPAAEAIVRDAFDKDMIIVGWSVGSLFGFDLLLPNATADSMQRAAQALSKEERFSFCGLIPYWTGTKTLVLRNTSETIPELGGSGPLKS